MGHGLTRKLDALRLEAKYEKGQGKKMTPEEEHLIAMNENELYENGAKLLNAIFSKRREATLDSKTLVKGLYESRVDAMPAVTPAPFRAPIRRETGVPPQSRVEENLVVPGTTRGGGSSRTISNSSRPGSRDSWDRLSDAGSSDRVSAGGSDSSYSRQRPEKDERKTYSQATGGARSSGGKGDSKGRGRPTGK